MVQPAHISKRSSRFRARFYWGFGDGWRAFQDGSKPVPERMFDKAYRHGFEAGQEAAEAKSPLPKAQTDAWAAYEARGGLDNVRVKARG